MQECNHPENGTAVKSHLRALFLLVLSHLRWPSNRAIERHNHLNNHYSMRRQRFPAEYHAAELPFTPLRVTEKKESKEEKWRKNGRESDSAFSVPDCLSCNYCLENINKTQGSMCCSQARELTSCPISLSFSVEAPTKFPPLPAAVAKATSHNGRAQQPKQNHCPLSHFHASDNIVFQFLIPDCVEV
jgi:hypothetical protein